MSCKAELRGLGAINDDLAEIGVKMVAVSVDAPILSRDVVKRLELPFPILADEQATVIREFGLLHKAGGLGGTDIAIPAHVLVDQRRRVRWKYIADRVHARLDEERVLESVRDALAKKAG